MRNLSSLEQRAFAAYFRSAARETGSVLQPGDVEEIEHGGLTYIRLSNVNGTLAVYRVRVVNGKPVLKGLKRWPKEVDQG